MASAGVAISDSPTGPFTYLRSFRPHGEECRDMTIFKVCSLSSLILHLNAWYHHRGHCHEARLTCQQRPNWHEDLCP